MRWLKGNLEGFFLTMKIIWDDRLIIEGHGRSNKFDTLYRHCPNSRGVVSNHLPLGHKGTDLTSRVLTLGRLSRGVVTGVHVLAWRVLELHGEWAETSQEGGDSRTWWKCSSLTPFPGENTWLGVSVVYCHVVRLSYLALKMFQHQLYPDGFSLTREPVLPVLV